MRVLQLTSDWKWTGPAEPMLQLLLALREGGFEVELACPAPPGAGAAPSRSLLSEARSRGIEPVLELLRGRGVRPLADAAEAARLASRLELDAIEVVHCWHTRDHVLALRAARTRRRAGHTSLVRSYRSAAPIRRTPWNRWLFGPGSDGLWCVSPGAARANAGLRGGRPIAGHFGAVDLDRFRPAPPRDPVRAQLGLEPHHVVVGIVARAQRHRRFDLLLEAAARLFARLPEARLLVIGRGTQREEVAEAPARRLGIAERVVFAGYRSADFVDVLRSMDVFTFLVPGSDGTCRALLEAAACGLPAVTTRRGALPEIVSDGHTGRLVDEDPDALAQAWEHLLRRPAERRAMGAAARKRAEALFAPARLADRTAQFYRSLRPGPAG